MSKYYSICLVEDGEIKKDLMLSSAETEEEALQDFKELIENRNLTKTDND